MFHIFINSLFVVFHSLGIPEISLKDLFSVLKSSGINLREVKTPRRFLRGEKKQKLYVIVYRADAWYFAGSKVFSVTTTYLENKLVVFKN